MSDLNSSHLNSVMPPQKIAFSKKNKKWKEQCVEAVSSMSNNRDLNGRSSYGRKQANYDLVNSILNEEDFKYVTGEYQFNGKTATQPARLRNYNLIYPKIALMKGEEMNRPFNWSAMAVNGNAISAKEEMEKKVLMQIAQKQIANTIQKELNSEDPVKEMPQTFEEMQKWNMYKNQDVREVWANRILQYIFKQDNLNLKFQEGWEHALIAAEEIYYVGIVNNEVKVRVVNPLLCEFDRNPDNPNIEDCDWFREDRWMTVGQIQDNFGSFLTDEQVRKLDQGDLRQGLSNQMFPGFGYTEKDIEQYDKGNFSNKTRSNSNHYLVTYVSWKSMKKIGFLNDFAEGVEDLIVDESFEVTEEMKANGIKVDWKWIPEVWEGVKIGDDFYVDIKPRPNQIRSMDNPYSVKLPYYGRVYNATNTEQTSIVDLIKPHQYLYNIIWFRMEAEVAKAKGKKLMIDYAQIPKSQGIDLEKFMYILDNLGIGLINSFEEGTGKLGQGRTSNFNQFSTADMSLSNSIGQYAVLLNKIESIVDKIIGITPQREGAISSSETAQGVERSVTQSSHITEPWFFIHDEIKKKVLQACVECSKFAFPKTKKVHYIADDLGRISTTIDTEKFADSDYGVFVSNSTKEAKVFQKLEMLANQALSSGAATFNDVIQMFNSNSVAELSKQIRASEEKKNQRDAQAQQSQIESNEKIQQKQLEFEFAKMDHESMENEKDRQNKIDLELIKKQEGPVGNVPNDLEIGKQGLEEAKAINQFENDKEKLNIESQKARDEQSNKEREFALKEKEIDSKERIEKLKAKTALKNKVSGEK